MISKTIQIGFISIFWILFSVNALAEGRVIVKGYGSNENLALNEAKKLL